VGVKYWVASNFNSKQERRSEKRGKSIFLLLHLGLEDTPLGNQNIDQSPHNRANLIESKPLWKQISSILLEKQ
jgi:hypothetical protein